MWALVQAVLAVVIGAVGMRLYLLDFKGYRPPTPPGKPSIDISRN